MIGMYFQIAALVLGLIALSGLVGLGPVSHLRVEVAARWVLAPVVGLAALVCACTTAIWWIPGNTIAWLVIPPMALIGAWWAWKRRRALIVDRRDAGVLISALAMVLALVCLLGYPLAAQRSLGPGGYAIADAPSYVGYEVSLQKNAITDKAWGPAWDLGAARYEGYSRVGVQQVGFSATGASLSSLIGTEPGRTEAPFMIALMLIGALGTLGASFVLIGRRWVAAGLLAAVLFAGPVMFQLFLDGSESAIIGIAFMIAMAAVGWVAVRDGDRASIVVLGLLSAGMQVGYPVLFPYVVAAGGLLWLASIGFRLVARRQTRDAVSDDETDVGSSGEVPSVGRVIGNHVRGGLAVVGLTAMLSLPHFIRNLDYWKLLRDGGDAWPGLPVFDLPLPVLPGWLLGTREFYNLPHTSDVEVSQWLLADVIPLALLALLVFAALTRRSLIPIVLLTVVTVVVALQVSAGGCSYCTQRSLLPLGALFGLLLSAGLVQIARRGGRLPRFGAAALGVLIAGVVLHTDVTLAKRGAWGAYFMPDSVHHLLDRIKGQPAPVLIEGFGASADAAWELPSAVHSARAGSDVRLDVIRESDDYNGLAYLGGPVTPSGPTLSGHYATIATRLAAIQTGRRTIFRDGDLAIQRRVGPFDATPISGILINRVKSLDDRVFVAGPVRFRVFGPAQDPAALEVQISDLARQNLVDKLAPGSTVTREGTGLRLCIPTTPGLGDRTVDIPVAPQLIAFAPPQWWGNKLVATGGPVINAVRVVATCAAASR